MGICGSEWGFWSILPKILLLTFSFRLGASSFCAVLLLFTSLIAEKLSWLAHLFSASTILMDLTDRASHNHSFGKTWLGDLGALGLPDGSFANRNSEDSQGKDNEPSCFWYFQIVC